MTVVSGSPEASFSTVASGLILSIGEGAWVCSLAAAIDRVCAYPHSGQLRNGVIPALVRCILPCVNIAQEARCEGTL